MEEKENALLLVALGRLLVSFQVSLVLLKSDGGVQME